MAKKKPIYPNKSIIGSGARFSGHISPASTLEIHGIVHADVIAEKLEIADGGSLEGNSQIGLAVINGRYHGRMKAKSAWLMHAARLSGEIEYGSVQMDRGAALKCNIVHNWEDDGSEQLVDLEYLDVENRQKDE